MADTTKKQEKPKRTRRTLEERLAALDAQRAELKLKAEATSSKRADELRARAEKKRQHSVKDLHDADSLDAQADQIDGGSTTADVIDATTTEGAVA